MRLDDDDDKFSTPGNTETEGAADAVVARNAQIDALREKTKK